MLFVSAVNFSQTKLDDVKVEAVKKGIRKSLTTTTNTSVVSSKELLKAACCNLAESFETNPSIDVNFADALTGTNQIKMLGHSVLKDKEAQYKGEYINNLVLASINFSTVSTPSSNTFSFLLP